MKSIIVFFLWIVACIVSAFVLLPTWMLFVTIPRGFWHAYRGTNQLEGGDWEMPWWAMGKTTEWVRSLDKKNKSDRIRESKPVVAGS